MDKYQLAGMAGAGLGTSALSQMLDALGASRRGIVSAGQYLKDHFFGSPPSPYLTPKDLIATSGVIGMGLMPPPALSPEQYVSSMVGADLGYRSFLESENAKRLLNRGWPDRHGNRLAQDPNVNLLQSEERKGGSLLPLLLGSGAAGLAAYMGALPLAPLAFAAGT